MKCKTDSNVAIWRATEKEEAGEEEVEHSLVACRTAKLSTCVFSLKYSSAHYIFPHKKYTYDLEHFVIV